MTTQNVTEMDLLAALAAELRARPRYEPGDVTAQMLAEAAGVTVKIAAATLAEKVKAGELTSFMGADASGHNARIYRRADKRK